MTNKIIADGHERLLLSLEMQEKIAEIRQDVEERYASELSQAGWFRRRLIRARIEKEVERAVDQIAPRDGLYFQ